MGQIITIKSLVDNGTILPRLAFHIFIPTLQTQNEEIDLIGRYVDQQCPVVLEKLEQCVRCLRKIDLMPNANKYKPIAR